MRLETVIPLLIILLPLTSALSMNQTQQKTFNSEIESLKVTQEPVERIGITTPRNFHLMNKDFETIRKISGDITPNIDTYKMKNGIKWLFGFQYSNSGFQIIDSNGNTLEKKEVNNIHDRGYFLNKNTVLSSYSDDPSIHNLTSGNKNYFTVPPGFPNRIASLETNTKAVDILLTGAGGRYIGLFSQNHFEYLKNTQLVFIPRTTENNVISGTQSGIRVRNIHTGQILWENEIPQISRFAVINGEITYSRDNKFKFLNLSNGKLVSTTDSKYASRDLDLHTYGDKILGVRGSDIYLFNRNMALLDSRSLDKPIREVSASVYRDKFLISSGEKLKVFRTEREKRNLQNLSGKIVYGNSRNILKAVSRDQEVIISEDPKKIEERTGLKSVKASNIDWKNFRTEERYYAESREKQVLLSVLASDRNASVTFQKSIATEEFTDTSLKKIRSRIHENKNINHLISAELDSKKGLFAAVAAAELNALPVDTQGNFQKSDEVIENRFDQIGPNSETVFDGRYVSLVGSPAENMQDPVPDYLSKSEGSTISSDLEYGNLDQDNELEAAVGRYPEDLEKASFMLRRSLERKRGGKAVVASEYLHSNWPVVLSTLGGGVRTGTAAEEIMEEQNYNVKHLVEHRARPLKLLDSIAGVPGLIKRTNKLEYAFSAVISEGSAAALKNGILVVKGLKYSEQALKVYLEYDWESYVADFSVELPSEPTVEELKVFADSLLPDRHPELNRSSLKREVGDAKMVYYSGRGDDRWILPDDQDNSIIKDFYSGQNSLSSENIDFGHNSIVFDSSNNGGDLDNPIQRKALEQSSNYLGFTDTSYHSYTAVVGKNFLMQGKTSGKGFLNGVNKLRDAFIVYNPESSYIPGVRKKMSSTARLYGNPETPKDPVEKQGIKTTKKCENGFCEVKVQIDPEKELREQGNQTSVTFNNSDYIIRPFKPVTPYREFRYQLPENSELTDYSVSEKFTNYSGISTPILKPLTHGGSTFNGSYNRSKFPRKTFRIENSADLTYIQALQQVRNENTRLLEKANLSFSYISDLTFELDKKDKNLEAEVFSSNKRTCSVEYRNGENKSVINFEIKGEKSFELEKLDPRIHEVEAAVICDDASIKTERTFRVERPVEIHVFAPDIAKSEVRKVKAVVENPNDFSVRKEMELKTGNNTAIDFLEESSESGLIPPNDSKVFSWKIIGLLKGKGTIKVGNSSENISVVEARESLVRNGIGSFFRSSGSFNRKVETEIRSDQKQIKLRSEKGTLTLRVSSGSRYQELSTTSYKVKRRITPDKLSESLETQNGFYRRTTISGNIITEKKNLGKQKFDSKISDLDREAEKFRVLFETRFSR